MSIVKTLFGLHALGLYYTCYCYVFCQDLCMGQRIMPQLCYSECFSLPG